MSEPEQRLYDAMLEEELIRSGEEYFEQNWYELVPKQARETIAASATQAKIAYGGAARKALMQADEALGRNEPAVAYFHVRRAVEGYIGSVLSRPIFEFLQNAVGASVPLFLKPLHSIFRGPFIEDLKRLTLEIITDDSEKAAEFTTSLRSFYATQAFRNNTFHSLHEPDIAVVADLRAAAGRLLDNLDSIVPS